MKTKPTQASVKELQGIGIQPDVIVCRSEHPLTTEIKDKIALFCNVPSSHVLQNLDVEYLYEAPLAMEKENLAQVVCESLHLPMPGTGSVRLDPYGRSTPPSEQRGDDCARRKVYPAA